MHKIIKYACMFYKNQKYIPLIISIQKHCGTILGLKEVSDSPGMLVMTLTAVAKGASCRYYIIPDLLSLVFGFNV